MKRWWDNEKRLDDRKDPPKGIDALGMPCLWKNFQIDCPYCEKAYKFFGVGNEKRGKELWHKSTVFALGFFFSDHKELQEYNNRLLCINIPIKEVGKEIIKRLKSGEWENDPMDIENGYVINIFKEKEKNDDFPHYLIAKGKDLKINKEELLKLYKKFQVVNPSQDKAGFFNWIYNKHPEMILVSWADIPNNVRYGIRFLYWPWKVEDSLVLEPDVVEEAFPFKNLRFHRHPFVLLATKLKEAGFDVESISDLLEEDNISESSNDEEDLPF